MRKLHLTLLALASVAIFVAVTTPAAQGSALDHDELPYYTHADLRPRWDMWSRWSRVEPVRLTGDDGGKIDRRSFAAGPTVVSFFWAGCATACPGSVELLKQVKGNPRVLLITDQPLTDSVAVLAEYRRKLALPDDWLLATGDAQEIYGFARRSLFTDVSARREDGLPRHTEVNYLIDRQGRVRGLYDAHSPADTIRLQADIERLRAESRVAPGLFSA